MQYTRWAAALVQEVMLVADPVIVVVPAVQETEIRVDLVAEKEIHVDLVTVTAVETEIRVALENVNVTADAPVTAVPNVPPLQSVASVEI